MNKTTWIVQAFDRDPSPSIPALVRAIVDAEYPLVRCRVVPFTDQMPDIPDDVELPILIYGMNTMIRNTGKHPKWRHGLFFDPSRFDPSAYTKLLGTEMLNADAELMTCEELAESGLDPSEQIFVRPNDDSKAFSGQVMLFRDYLKWYRAEMGDPEYVDLDPDMPVLCSSCKEIMAEYRTFILDKKVIASSQYLPVLREFTPPEVVEFAEDIAMQYAPADAFVCDVAVTNDGLKIIEFNCINGCGFYAANVDVIVRLLSLWQEQVKSTELK